MKKAISWKNKLAKKEYLEALKNDANMTAISYEKSQNHSVGDYINHSTFGLGFIQKILSHTRVEVFFESSEKIMIQNWQQS